MGGLIIQHIECVRLKHFLQQKEMVFIASSDETTPNFGGSPVPIPLAQYEESSLDPTALTRQSDVK